MEEQKERTPKQQKQHEAYRRWYESEKGKAYRDKAKVKRTAEVKEPELQS